jgi:hypothetical protein
VLSGERFLGEFATHIGAETDTPLNPHNARFWVRGSWRRGLGPLGVST